MAVTAGNIIEADDYNNLQGRIAALLGTGSGQNGYGQTLNSSQVTAPGVSNDGDVITEVLMDDLRKDLQKAYFHQTAANTPVGNIAQGDIIGANVSGTDLTFDPDDDSIYTFVNEATNKGFNDFLTVMSVLETNKFSVAASQTDGDDNIVTPARTTSFNGEVNATVKYNFGNANARRHFFNAGGRILFEGVANAATEGAVGTDSYDRNVAWAGLIQSPGQISFAYNNVTYDGANTGVSFPEGAIGNYQLSTTYQVIFRRDASAGNYGDSYWEISARTDPTDANSIEFLFTLVDDGPESDADAGDKGSIAGGVPEPVTIDFEFRCGAERALSSVGNTDDRYFVIPFPSVSISDDFQ